MDSNYQAGHDAEKRAAEYMQQKGYKILDLNWKTKLCEIDIIAQKNNVVFFTEVKYRKNRQQGEGFDYLTAKKLHQMTFAAEFWVSQHNWDGSYQLAAISMSPTTIELVELA